jgi:hypothetical protein
MFNIFEEITWPQFQNLDGIRQLSLNEQIHKYNQYLSELSLARDYYYQFQVKGPQTGFLQQENLFYVLQEDGGKIIIT